MLLTPPLGDKTKRVETLRNFHVLNPGLDVSFDDFTQLAAEICQTPMAQVSFTDSEKFWPKSVIGLAISEESVGCCPFTILQSDIFEVHDTLKDDRFMSAPWVLSDPGIRYYAGVSLISEDGITIGTLSVMDHKPRLLTLEQKQRFLFLAHLVISNLECRDQLQIFKPVDVFKPGGIKSEDTKQEEQEELAAELNRTRSLLGATLESTTDGVLIFDPAGKIVRFNPQFVKMWEIPESIISSGHDQIISSLLDLLKEPERFLQKTTARDDPSAGINFAAGINFDVLELKNGKTFECYSHAQWGDEGNLGQVWSFRDTTERYRQAALLRHSALYDALTDLPNRVLLQDRLQQAILLGRREGKSFALLIMDLDRFKEVNNTLGHKYGDLLLQQIGARVQTILRKSDTLARMGGDEFAILLLGPVTIEDATGLSEKILEVLEDSFTIEGVSLDISASIGMALFPDHGDQVYTLLKRADVAMYMAKTSERRIAVYTSLKDQYSLRRLTLKNDLRHAIHNDQLFLLYQPKVNLQTRSVTGVEALVRWQHPQLGIVPPDEFIGLAEQTGLIKPLTVWVLKAALNQLIQWQKVGINFPVAVNLSVRSLRDSKLIDQIVELIQVFGILPQNLELEITESMIMDDPSRAMEIVTGLGRMGIKFAIDDFGTGYSSLSYLKRLPIQSIKIDKSFISDMMNDGDDEIIVLSIIELAHNLGMKVIAEGVENQETWDRLHTAGCDEVQGYFLSRPVSGKEIIHWVQKAEKQKTFGQ